MGGILSNSAEQTINTNQENISELNRIEMERLIQMHFHIKEREHALEISRKRELFYWISGFYLITLGGILTKFRKTKRLATLAPLVPLTFINAYYADLAYGSKIERIRDEASMIMQHEPELLQWPCGLPTVSAIDQARLNVEIEKKMHPVPPSL